MWLKAEQKGRKEELPKARLAHIWLSAAKLYQQSVSGYLSKDVIMLETNLLMKRLKKIYYFSFTKLRNMTGIKDEPEGNDFLAQAMKAYWVSIINLGSRWRRVVHFTLLPPYPRWKYPANRLTRGWVSHRERLGLSEKMKSTWSHQDRTPDSPGRSLVTIPTELHRLEHEWREK